MLQEIPGTFVGLVKQLLDAICLHAKSKLPSDRIPTFCIAVENLLLTVSERVDRKAVCEWLKAKAPIQRRPMV